MIPGAGGWMVQGTLGCGDSTSAEGDRAGGAGKGDTIVYKCCGMNGCPSRGGPHCWRQEFS